MNISGKTQRDFCKPVVMFFVLVNIACLGHTQKIANVQYTLIKGDHFYIDVISKTQLDENQRQYYKSQDMDRFSNVQSKPNVSHRKTEDSNSTTIVKILATVDKVTDSTFTIRYYYKEYFSTL